MKRVAEKQLLDWKNANRRKPLIIRGARQVGKSWLADQFGNHHFKHYVKVDLEKRRDLCSLFDENLEPTNIVQLLELEFGTIAPSDTLLFFDEIQACPRAITALRYFYEQLPELHVLAAGSLLEFACGTISIPVGRVQYLHLYPLSFYEYLLAIHKDQMAYHSIRSPQETPERVQQKILAELRTFFFIGGMPEAVQTFVDTRSLVKAFQVQSEILETYRDDFHKYTPHVDSRCIDAVLLNAASQVGEQIKYTKLNDAHTSATNRKAFELLVNAKLLHKIPSASPSGLPLGASVNQKRFKTVLLDIGLMQRLCQLPVDREIKRTDLLAIYRGKLAEQFVAQELIAWNNPQLYYWAREARGSSAEVDYLIAKQGKIFPLEVKSGAGGSLRSMHLLLKQYSNCDEGLVLYSGPYKQRKEQNLTFVPLYGAGPLGDQQRSIC